MQKELNKDYFLWKSFKNGDEKAFCNLYDLHIDSLYRFGMQFSADSDFIKDCIHDLFLDLFKYRNQLSDTDSIQYYLFRSLRRKIYKELSRRLPVNHENYANQNELKQPTIEDSIIRDEIELENYRLLQKAFEGLTGRQREALFLRFEQDLAYPEIADILDVSVDSARTIIYRAIKVLRESIQKKHLFIDLLHLLFRENK
ncbi:RNA polymerase sigma factor [Gaoshiqia sp. Z1-71]|uniref:RNA polymerase sigma factor n=1 Tax=Gaoshiqia hydrogeniformans TaxID=3290090 RepID=UPI003BF784AB